MNWNCLNCGDNIENVPGFISIDDNVIVCYGCSDMYNDRDSSLYSIRCGYCDDYCFHERPYSIDTVLNTNLIFHQSCHKKAKEMEGLTDDILRVKNIISTCSSKHKLGRYKKMISSTESKLESLYEIRNKKRNEVYLENWELLKDRLPTDLSRLREELDDSIFELRFNLYRVEKATAMKKMNLINADRILDTAKFWLKCRKYSVRSNKRRVDDTVFTKDYEQYVYDIVHGTRISVCTVQ